MSSVNFDDLEMPFIALEGLDGAGKSTALSVILEELEKAGYEYIQTREPGGTPLAEKLRDLIKYHENEKIFVEAETNMFYASRVQNVFGVIIPALKSGKAVVSDRFSDSTKAYQGARGQSIESIDAIRKASIGEFKPDLTVYLDINLITSKARMNKRNEKLDNLEQGADDFFNNARKIYLDIAKEEPERFKTVNAMNDIQEVAEDVRKVVSKFLVEFKKKQELKQVKEKKKAPSFR